MLRNAFSCSSYLIPFLILSSSIPVVTNASISPPPPSSTTTPPFPDDPNPSIPWDTFTFSLNNVSTDYMWLDRTSAKSPSYSNSPSCIVPLSPLPLHPASTVLNYGQSLFEGLKAFRRSDGSIALFRPDQNALRMNLGAKRLLLPPIPPETFLEACRSVVRSNARWIPPHTKGALYLRPILFGSGAELGVKPSTESTFCIYASPVGTYFKKGSATPINLCAVKTYCRASMGGSGGVKAGGNYAPCFLPQQMVREDGYDEALFLDSERREAVEEAGASNFFAVFGNNTIVTPPLEAGTILPGITRDSILELARRECGCDVLERRLTVDDLGCAEEAFCCGTGASVTPVGSVNVMGSEDGGGDDDVEKHIVFGDGKTVGEVTRKLHKLLTDIQMGTGEDEGLHERYKKWIHVVKGRVEQNA